MTASADHIYFLMMYSRYSQLFIPPGGDAPGSSAAHLAARRNALLPHLQRPLLILGTASEPGSEHLWWSNPRMQIQEPQFLYLTGINQPGIHLLLNPFAPQGEEALLFLPWRDSDQEFWTGIAFGLERSAEEGIDSDLAQLCGISKQLPAEGLLNSLLELQKQHGSIALFCHDYAIPDQLPEAFLQRWSGEMVDSVNGDSGARLRKREAIDLQRSALESQGVRFIPLPELLLEQRVVMDAPQMHGLKSAQEVAHRAFLEMLSSLRQSSDEMELHRSLDDGLMRRTPWGVAFPTIVAGGANACTLHYVRNQDPLRPGDLLLFDFGARWGTLSSDISRTVPISGRFDPMQRLLYEIVLETQQFHQSQVRAGAFLHQLNSDAWDFLEQLLQERFTARGGEMRRSYASTPHGISHLIGEQVHEGDPFRLSNYAPLRSGMVISNEPGLYGEFSIELDGVHYSQAIGIRIEDDLLVGEQGAINLSAAFPHTVEEIEEAMAF